MDPVLAEDGRIYERSAIEGWFKQTALIQSGLSHVAGRGLDALMSSGGRIKSPTTNERIGLTLVGAIQVCPPLSHPIHPSLLSISSLPFIGSLPSHLNPITFIALMHPPPAPAIMSSRSPSHVTSTSNLILLLLLASLL